MNIAISSYWIDLQPSRGMGQNKGRPTATGIYRDGKLVCSLPPRLNQHDLPSIKQVKAILAGNTTKVAT